MDFDLRERQNPMLLSLNLICCVATARELAFGMPCEGGHLIDPAQYPSVAPQIRYC